VAINPAQTKTYKFNLETACTGSNETGGTNMKNSRGTMYLLFIIEKQSISRMAWGSPLLSPTHGEQNRKFGESASQRYTSILITLPITLEPLSAAG
jgi:hypothetical protein